MNAQELRAKEEDLIRAAGEALALNTEEGDARHDELMAEANVFGARAAKVEALEKRAASFDAADPNRPVENRSVDTRAKAEADLSNREERAYSDFLRGKVLEARAVMTTADNGDLIPATAASKILEVLEKANPLMGVVNSFTTATGATYNIPKGDDRAGTAYDVDEGVDAGDTDVAFETVAMGARLASTGMVQITRSMIQDDAYDIQGYVARKFGTRMGKFLAGRMTSGNGTTQVQGLVTGLTAASRVIESAASTGLTFKDLMAAEEEVDDYYHDGAVWLLNRKTLNAFRGLTDSDGAPVLFQGNYANGAPATILGKPYVIVPTFADNQVGFGNFKEAYAFRQVAGLSIATANELYIKKNTVGVIGFMRYDAKLLNGEAAVILNKKAV